MNRPPAPRNPRHAPRAAPPNEEGPSPTRKIAGDYRVWPSFPSARLALPRDIIIWLPPDYPSRPGHRFPVLYMHDGQQVFDPLTSTWQQDWRVDDIAQQLIPAGKMESCIIVAIYCTTAREREYDPNDRGNAYLAFLLDELKPRIDTAFLTRPDRNAIAGSSMGGLISFYALFQHPHTFQAAGVLSPAFCDHFDRWQSLLRQCAQTHTLPTARLFMSCGNAGTLEKSLNTGTRHMASLLAQVHYPGPLCLRYPPHAEHNEAAWSRLVPDLLPFLFPPAPTPPRPQHPIEPKPTHHS